MSEEAIVVIDDDKDMREAITRIVSRRGLAVIAVESGAMALSGALAGSPNGVRLVIADLGATGSGFGRKVAEASPDTRVIYVSGRSRRDAERQGLIGADDTLVSKPFTTATLRAAVDRALT